GRTAFGANGSTALAVGADVGVECTVVDNDDTAVVENGPATHIAGHGPIGHDQVVQGQSAGRTDGHQADRAAAAVNGRAVAFDDDNGCYLRQAGGAVIVGKAVGEVEGAGRGQDNGIRAGAGGTIVVCESVGVGIDDGLAQR